MKYIKTTIFTLFLVVPLLFSSCYAQLTELLIAAIEDDYAPVIVLQTPISGDSYYSTINVTGYINDDSLGSGDDKGLLRSLSITAANDLDHKGKIIIDAEGGYEFDTAFGNLGAADFVYNPADRSFDITITTSDLGYPPQTLYIVINAQDFNGNESTVVLPLIRSEGPFLEITQPAPDESYYAKEGSITIRGAVGDSYLRPGEADEVASIRLDILALGISAEVDTSSGDASEPLFPRNGTLEYDYTVDAQGQFLCEVDLISSDDGVTSLTINVIATDKNGNTSTASHSMLQIPDDAGPVVTFTTPYTSGTYYYSIKPEASALLYVNGATKTPMSSLMTTGWVYSLVSGRLVDTAEMKLSSGGSSNTIDIKSHGGTISYLPPIYPKDYYNYNISYSGATFKGFGGQGAELKLTATDDTADSNVSEYTWQIREDSDGPNFTPGSISTIPSATFVGPSHLITLTFHVADGSFETGLDPATVAGTVGGNISIAGYLTDDGSGNYTVTDLPLTTASQSTGDLDIDITASDEIGNESSLDESAFTTINFLSGVPVLTAISIAADASPTDAAKSGDTVTLAVTSDQSLEPDDLDILIAGVTATVNEASPANTLTATATIPGGYAIDPVPFQITGFKNAVGTAGNVPVPITAVTDGSSVKLYTSGPILTVTGISSATGSDAYAKSSEIVTITVSSNQPLDQAPTVKIGDTNSNETLAGDNLSFTAVSSSGVSDLEGQITVDFADIENIVGLTTTGYSEAISAWFYPGKPTLSSVTMALEKGGGNVDADPEEGDIITLEFSVVNSRILQSDPTVSFNSDTTDLTSALKDGGTTAPEYRYTYTVGATDLTLVDPIAYTIDFTDAAGNVGDRVSATSTIDLTP